MRGNVVFILEEGRLFLFTLTQGHRLRRAVRDAMRRAGPRTHAALGGEFLACAVACRLAEAGDRRAGGVGVSLSRQAFPDHPEVHVDVPARRVREVEVVDAPEANLSRLLERVLAEWTFEEFVAGHDPVSLDARDADLGIGP